MKTKFLYLSIALTLTACSKIADKLSSTQVPKGVLKDTISLDLANYNCNLSYNTDTCFFQRLNDTLKIYGKVLEHGCVKHIAVIEERNDSIVINSSEINLGNGAVCELVYFACFEIYIPKATNYFIVIFDGKTYSGF